MYQPPGFKEDRPDILHGLIRDYPLGTLITTGPAGLMASQVPFLVHTDGALRCHLARGNAQLTQLAANPQVMVIFQGPAGYISPSWYASKAEHGRVVPTWNYATVHAWGPASLHDDAAWLHDLVDHLTRAQEKHFAQPWHVNDAPADYMANQLRGIVGVEILPQRLEGTWKMSQNRNAADRAGVIAGLQAAHQPKLAALVAARGTSTTG